ncbi:4-alpha-glucanotransferase [Paracraurococcus ruber]|uniref:4-alpha-glucanotransferase n=1 Tax=Paracraurococcus ruber TaxID=77675 RepID=A0ABS1D104_9PROT|nr:4-alpha-glucanotransferase [Paracraurococcus ruber]MBK1660290.1 4-alpha-glucanotransferase [Paracraurococcus ruber]TDG29723.1 4-alpha-glucanotransferase [Paracraurococcus ruber]
MTTDDDLRATAEAAGIATTWRDVRGEAKTVAPDTLRAVLAAQGLPEDAEAAKAALDALAQRLPPLITMTIGPDGVHVPGAAVGHRFRLDIEGGDRIEGHLERGWGGEARLPAISTPGYHRLHLDDAHCIVAAAPPRCVTLGDLGADAHGGHLPWALAAQIHALRGARDMGIGDFGAVAALAHAAGRRGCAAIAVSPAHALFSADVTKYGPYSPSSRIFSNVLYADPAAALGEVPGDPGPPDELIDWPAAARRKLARLRALYDRAADHPGFVDYRSQAGTALEAHARFEALHAHLYGRDPALWHWRDWPAEFQAPDSPGMQRFARDHAPEVAFHAFCQWLADASRGAAQAAAREAGMPVGLIADLAVGTDGGGSHAWSHQRAILPDVTVGAPPDIFSPLGQDWGLTAFSPLEMRAGGFGAFLELLRAAFRHSGGVRVDHAMGLQRLWVVPRGAGPAEGAYLRYPIDDLVRLLALESHRHRAIVIGEDLGTLPDGFHQRMEQAGILGMKVLWFEQEQDGSFRSPRHWPRNATAMTTTHDLPTVVGWWQGRDIGWRSELGLFPDAATTEREEAQRTRDRGALWTAFLESGAATGDQPPPDQGVTVVDTALAHVGGANCALAILPLEDALAMPEQPNLPGTVAQHPNWQRRMPGDAATLLDDPAVARRVEAFARARPRA